VTGRRGRRRNNLWMTLKGRKATGNSKRK
jgi:hypothetical protein